MRLAAASLLSAVIAVLTLMLTEDSRMAVVALVAVLGLNVAARFATARGLFAAFCMFLIAPGLFGEASSIITAGGVVALVAVIVTYRRDTTSRRTGLEMLAVASMASVALGMLIVGQPILAGIVLTLAVAAVLAARRRAFLVRMARGLVIIYAAFVVSYLVTMVIGFEGSQIANFEFGRRTVELYLPFTPATAGPPIIPGTRRGAPLIGEPGLVIFYLLPLAGMTFTSTTRKQQVWLIVLVVGVLLTVQSLASLLVGVAVIVLGISLQRLQRRSIGIAVLVAAVAAIAAPGLVTSAFEAKNAAASVSFTDRGFGSDVGNNNINLLVALENTPLLGATIIVALVFAFLICSRSLPGIVMWVAFASTAVAAQPSHWQFGAWFLLVAYALSFALEPEDRARIAPLGSLGRSRPDLLIRGPRSGAQTGIVA